MAEPQAPNLDALLAQARSQFQAGQIAESMALSKKALELNPQCAEALHLMGILALRQGKLVSAEDLLRVAISHNRLAPNYYCNLAQVLSATGRSEEAIEFCRRGIELQRNDFESFFILGKVLRTAGRVEESLQAYRRSIELRPDFAPAHVNLGMLQLLTGDFQHGWAELEWRWERPEMRRIRDRFDKPRWDGSPLRGRRILLYAEPGVNDVIQFCRFAPLVAKADGQVVVQVQPELTRLLRSLEGAPEVVTSEIAPAPAELQSPLMSLPRTLGTTLSTIPAHIPYLAADARDAENWGSRIASLGSGITMNIGIVGHGAKDPPTGVSRPLPLEAIIRAIGPLPSIRYFVMQKEDSKALQAQELPSQVIDWTADLKDLADTAALMQNLSLMITHDSALAHLAGAIGKKVWLLLPKVADWRWMLDRADSPWYPTMQIFRQREKDSWDEPLAEITRRLREGAL